ncbi:MAG: flavodoxin family protein [Anaerolineales bacterium]|jgi:multimeric flavodoxin WrbA|nr:flavodoxin family protein [Anaerolineales bacterium]
MSKSILILNGSPREKGNSAALADQLTLGAKEVGAVVESIYLHDMDIRPCDACDFCQENGDGCVIGDDMQTLYPKLRAADAIVIATPVYWYSLTAQMKLCIDRWYAMELPSGFELAGKQLALVMVYGDTDLYTSGGITVIYTIEGICRYVGLEVAGIVHGTANDMGDAEKQPALMEQAYQLGQKLAAVQ